MFLKLVHPSTILVSGPTGCGKTQFVIKLLNEDIFEKQVNRIIWIYSEWQQSYQQLENRVDFRKEVDEALYNSLVPTMRNLIVLDDQMSKIGDSKILSRLFTEGSHHRNLSIIYIVQNLFDKGRAHRTVSLNAQYLVLFKNPRDKSQIDCLARQMYPGHVSFLVAAFQEATKQSYGYLFIDLRPETPEDLRVRTRIFPSDGGTDVYLP